MAERIVGVRLDTDQLQYVEQVRQQLRQRNPDMRKITLSDAMRWIVTNSSTAMPVDTLTAIVKPTRIPE
jgi:nicotinic acid phosphoribosyltransferase